MIAKYLDDEVIKSLSQNELQILHYIYDHIEDISNLSIQEFSKRVSFSTATILRFCKKLHLSGYSELKYYLKEHDLAPKTIPCDTTLENPFIYHDIYSDIENTSLLIKEENIQKTIQELASDKSIHLFGSGVSGHVLDYFQKMLFSFGRQKVYRYEATQLGYHIADTLTKQDILIAISTSGEFAPTIKIVNLAKMHHATVIAITPYTKNSIANIADINFRFFVNQRNNDGAEYTSRLPIFYIIHSIFTCYLKYLENKEGK